MSWEMVVAVWDSVAPHWLGRLALALVVAIAAWLVGRAARGWMLGLADRTRIDPHMRFLAAQLLYWLVLALGLLVVLAALGIEESVLLTTFGAAGLALGLAAQDVIKSFFAGLYILFERPFVIGDEIQVKEHIGRVEQVGFRATSIVTTDDVRVVVPNVLIFSEIISNRTQRRDAAQQPQQTTGQERLALRRRLRQRIRGLGRSRRPPASQ